MVVKKVIAIISVALVSVASLFAQEIEVTPSSINLSLEQAQEMAVERNITLANASLDIKAAEANRWIAISSMLPQISAKGNYSNMLGYQMNFSGSKIAMPAYVDLGITTSVAVSGAMIVNTKIAQISKEMSDVNFNKSSREIKDQVKTLYFSALVTEQIAELLSQSIESLRKLYNMTQESVNAGVAEQTSADQIQVQVASVENSLSSTKRSIEMSYNSLRLLLNLDAETEINLTDDIDLLIATNQFLKLINEEFNLDNNYSYQLVQKNTDLSKQQYNAAMLNCTPTLSAYYQYTAKKYLSDQMTLNMTPPNMLGVSLSIPIFTSLNKTKSVQSAKISYQKQLNTLDQTGQQLQVQHRQLCYNLTNALELYLTQRRNMDVTQKVYDNIAAKYKEGLSSALELTQTSNNLLTAQNSYIQSLLSLITAQIELEQLLNK